MNHYGKKRKLFYDLIEWMYIVSSALFAFLGWANSVKETDSWIVGRTVVWYLIENAQRFSFYIYCVLGALILFGFIYRKKGDPWVLEKIKFTLDQYQYKAFSGSTAPQDHNRITLFKHERSCFFKKHWSATKWWRPSGDCPVVSNYLVPYLRSGHISQNTKAIFYAPDDSDRAEGVAALAWSARRTVMQDNLPDLKATSSDLAVRKYATRTHSKPEMVKKYLLDGRPLARSIAAIPIESGGEIWGVVVLDSREPQGVTNEAVNDYQVVISLIGQLLEKA